jgi:hypothetical protein
MANSRGAALRPPPCALANLATLSVLMEIDYVHMEIDYVHHIPIAGELVGTGHAEE